MEKDVELIIDSGADVDTADKNQEKTPLHYAAASGERNTWESGWDYRY